MAVPLIDLADQHELLREPLEAAFAEVLASGQFILGPYVEKFERELAEYCQVEHAIGVSSGTDALLVALMALDIGPGDEVITTPFTFFATAGCISRVGAKPVFVDIVPRTYNLDVEQIEGALTRQTKAIIPVHLFGLPANMGPINDLAKANNLAVIEDAAQALGARYDDKPVGSIGDVGCFSFYPTKSVPALGDGGAVVTNDAKLADKIRMLRVHGSDRGYHFPLIGGNFRLDAIQAAVLSIKLKHLNGWVERRREIADRYGRKFEDLAMTTPFEPDVRFHAYNQYTVRVRGGQREAVRHHLDACGIGTRVYYPEPVHLQPCYTDLNYRPGNLPAAEAACEEVLSLPIYPEMTNAQQDEVVAAVREFFKAE
ncbi:DegT/DnrJ/EryC1/StrS family aminotransferase [Phycisphaerales bacterium AB-hyl4]|uniref:DegT/DnrJ/EryC1/StrS family aminotransferase n=1 Tax=Natronomicrosphaera hydrolytica TaxID=3242702 RepID=A0ABV4U0D1_9BACT